jgi:hypothetical protein
LTIISIPFEDRTFREDVSNTFDDGGVDHARALTHGVQVDIAPFTALSALGGSA